jgi:8-oxo-dGTP pyrophosphatase MutT (NUDIX family)
MEFESQKLLTLMLLLRKSKILLGMKKRGFGQGKWNGFGGKVEKNESIYSAAVREVEEECGIKVLDAKFVGFITFTFKIEKIPMQVHVFRSNNFEGDPIETEEMKPEWFDICNIPYENMWKDDLYWYPYLIDNKIFRAQFDFEDYENILSYKIEEKEYDDLLNIQSNLIKHNLF